MDLESLLQRLSNELDVFRVCLDGDGNIGSVGPCHEAWAVVRTRAPSMR